MCEKRLIDANALKIAFKMREMADIDMYGGCHIPECFQGHEANAIVDKMPTVDAVEVVRCFECQKEGTEDCPMVHKDALFRNLYAENKPDDFCSYGKRKPENDTKCIENEVREGENGKCM